MQKKHTNLTKILCPTWDLNPDFSTYKVGGAKDLEGVRPYTLDKAWLMP